MKKQKVTFIILNGCLISDEEKRLNKELEDGWTVVSVTTCPGFGTTIGSMDKVFYGTYCVVLEREE